VSDRVRNAKLPLAVYREVAAHLRLIDGVETDLIPQSSSVFDYDLSQVDSLVIRYRTDDADGSKHAQVQQVLAYYGDCYGNWDAMAECEQS
jgi:hypothetical protein